MVGVVLPAPRMNRGAAWGLALGAVVQTLAFATLHRVESPPITSLRKLGRRALRNIYFRDALQHLTDKPCPHHFQFRRRSQITEIHQWCALNVRPHWACGISLMEAAERYVVDAEDNANIIWPEAGYAQDWDP